MAPLVGGADRMRLVERAARCRDEHVEREATLERRCFRALEEPRPGSAEEAWRSSGARLASA